MKNKSARLLFTSILTATLLVACGSTSNVETNTEQAPVESEQAEAHEHVYTEEVTAEATCEEDGVKTFTCECGDSYTEAIPATGHTFVNYVYNDDATSDADGTETATCENCDVTDTRTAEGTMAAYTYTDMSATKYAKQTVNVRSLPSTDGEKVGSLSLNDAVTVTGKCNETGWYRIEYSNDVAYVSDSYLVDNKIETQAASSTVSDVAEEGTMENGQQTSMDEFANQLVDSVVADYVAQTGASEEEAALLREALWNGEASGTVDGEEHTFRVDSIGFGPEQ
jgi:uncharacterized protein YgiM (DUF1202 family)